MYDQQIAGRHRSTDSLDDQTDDDDLIYSYNRLTFKRTKLQIGGPKTKRIKTYGQVTNLLSLSSASEFYDLDELEEGQLSNDDDDALLDVDFEDILNRPWPASDQTNQLRTFEPVGFQQMDQTNHQIQAPIYRPNFHQPNHLTHQQTFQSNPQTNRPFLLSQPINQTVPSNQLTNQQTINRETNQQTFNLNRQTNQAAHPTAQSNSFQSMQFNHQNSGVNNKWAGLFRMPEVEMDTGSMNRQIGGQAKYEQIDYKKENGKQSNGVLSNGVQSNNGRLNSVQANEVQMQEPLDSNSKNYRILNGRSDFLANNPFHGLNYNLTNPLRYAPSRNFSLDGNEFKLLTDVFGFPAERSQFAADHHSEFDENRFGAASDQTRDWSRSNRQPFADQRFTQPNHFQSPRDVEFTEEPSTVPFFNQDHFKRRPPAHSDRPRFPDQSFAQSNGSPFRNNFDPNEYRVVCQGRDRTRRWSYHSSRDQFESNRSHHNGDRRFAAPFSDQNQSRRCRSPPADEFRRRRSSPADRSRFNDRSNDRFNDRYADRSTGRFDQSKRSHNDEDQFAGSFSDQRFRRRSHNSTRDQPESNRFQQSNEQAPVWKRNQSRRPLARNDQYDSISSESSPEHEESIDFRTFFKQPDYAQLLAAPPEPAPIEPAKQPDKAQLSSPNVYGGDDLLTKFFSIDESGDKKRKRHGADDQCKSNGCDCSALFAEKQSTAGATAAVSNDRKANDLADAYAMSFAEFMSLQVNLSQLESWINLKSLKKAVVGCFVRVPINEEFSKFSVGQIVDVIEQDPRLATYPINGQRTNKHLVLFIPESIDKRTVVRVNFISNVDFTEKEFHRWTKIGKRAKEFSLNQQHINDKQQHLKQIAIEQKAEQEEAKKRSATVDRLPKNETEEKGEMVEWDRDL